MSLNPLFSSPMPIPSHAVAALIALTLFALQLAVPKGTQTHRAMGWAALLALGYAAVSAVFIWDLRLIGPFSPIHILIPITLHTIWYGLRAVRRGEIDVHRRQMRLLFFLALILPGAFTLLPGRVMHEVIFGPLGGG